MDLSILFENTRIQKNPPLIRCILILKEQLVSLYFQFDFGSVPVEMFSAERLLWSGWCSLLHWCRFYSWLLLATTVWYWPKGSSVFLCRSSTASMCFLYVQFCDSALYCLLFFHHEVDIPEWLPQWFYKNYRGPRVLLFVGWGWFFFLLGYALNWKLNSLMFAKQGKHSKILVRGWNWYGYSEWPPIDLFLWIVSKPASDESYEFGRWMWEKMGFLG